MKKRLLCFTMLLTVTISAITFTNNVKAATKWNTSKSVTKEENGIKYSAYLTAPALPQNNPEPCWGPLMRGRLLPGRT